MTSEVVVVLVMVTLALPFDLVRGVMVLMRVFVMMMVMMRVRDSRILSEDK